jgi:hypothetical protein
MRIPNRIKAHAPSILAGVRAISKATRCLLPFYDLRRALLYLLFFSDVAIIIVFLADL